MRNYIFTLAIVFFITTVANGRFPNMYRNIKQEKIVGDPGEPLLLTSFIQENRIDEALAAAQVDSELFLGVKSYAGYFTVREQYNANLFFWFFPSESDYENDPVVLWLQGGPGATSLFGLFEEHGPFSVDDNTVLQLREYSWSKSHSVIYIDNPVGTGYSFADSDGLAKDETQVGADLYEALIQFFTLFPELQKNEFYITGESYAGKYVPAIGYTILQQNPSASSQINLQGLAIGNGFSDPANQINYGDYLFQLGFVDSNTQQKLKDNEKEVQELVSQGEYIKANVVLDLNQPNNIFYTATGYYNYYNFLYPVDPVSDVGMDKFVQTEEARLAMHVGSTVLNSGNVYGNLEADVMQSVTPWISELLSNYKVMFYNGQLDIIVAYPFTVNMLQLLDFNGADEYKVAERHIWRVDSEIAGYVKEAGNLTEVLVRRSGHMVPTDQPKWAYDLISKFTRNQRLYDD